MMRLKPNDDTQNHIIDLGEVNQKEKEREKRTLFVTGAFFDGVALSALGSEDLLTGFRVSGRCFIERRHLIEIGKNLKRCVAFDGFFWV